MLHMITTCIILGSSQGITLLGKEAVLTTHVYFNQQEGKNQNQLHSWPHVPNKCIINP